MTFLKEHHHTLLVTLFLIGALFVAGSFEARLPDSAIAATTPGSQSTVLSFEKGVCSGGEENESCTTPHLDVIYTGELRTPNGNLTASDTKLKPGDQVSLKIIENASFFAAGGSYDSPPAPWIGGVGSGECKGVAEYTIWTQPDQAGEEQYCMFVDKPAV